MGERHVRLIDGGERQEGGREGGREGQAEAERGVERGRTQQLGFRVGLGVRGRGELFRWRRQGLVGFRVSLFLA